MNCRICLLFAGWLLIQTVSETPSFAADPPAGVAAACPNAAAIYWQAFAAMPTLSGEEQAKYEAAIKTPSGPVSDDVKPIVAKFDAALRELHRASAVAACDWNLNYDAGPELLLPHLQKARELSRAALLRARVRFAAGNADEAVADVVAVLKMARDCGSSPVLISLLVDIAIENMATDVLAANLPKLAPQSLDTLAESLKKLPATPSLEDCVRLEGQIFGDWLERFINAAVAKVSDPKAAGKLAAASLEKLIADSSSQANANDAAGSERRKFLESVTIDQVRESLRLLREDYAELAKIVALGPAECRVRLAEFEAKLAEGWKSAKREDRLRVLSRFCLPAVAKLPEREDRFLVRRNLLTLAIQVQRHGPDTVKAVAIPDHGPVEYRKTAVGFELRCQPAAADKPEVLQVGEIK